MKKEKIVVIKPAKTKFPEVRDHLRTALNCSMQHGSPMTGYALVTFHENRSFGAYFHVDHTNVAPLDVGDMAKNRLNALVISNHIKGPGNT